MDSGTINVSQGDISFFEDYKMLGMIMNVETISSVWKYM